MSGPWRVRAEGAPVAKDLPSAERVLIGLRDGEWAPTDEVRGPNDAAWRTIEDHPLFAEIVADMEPPSPEKPDETHLDMNPLIDVALVLLIFFILTATYSTLRRAIELPPEPPEDKAKATTVIKKEDIKDRVFKVRVRMEGGKPIIKVEEKVVLPEEVEREITEFVKNTGRKEMFADVGPDVPWGVEALIYDAAKGAGVHEIYWPKGK